MRRTKHPLLLFIILLVFSSGYGQYKNTPQSTHISRLELPKISSSDIIIKHFAYTLAYSEAHEQAKWVAYELTSAHTSKAFERTNKFLVDPLVKTGSATDGDYKGSGYDRGHLAPAGDMSWSYQSMRESFYYSNMSPQEPAFNRGVWKRLEDLVRTWAKENGKIYIATGPILKGKLPKIGINGVAVPEYYYKVILDYSEPSIKGIGFILPNMGSSASLQSYALSIDSVEKVTSLDFFIALPDKEEARIESNISLESWSWKNTSTAHKVGHSAQSVQCNGTTKTGNRCRNWTRNPSGFCYLHESQAHGYSSSTYSDNSASSNSNSSNTQVVQCSGITKAGNRCKRMTSDPSKRCYQHRD